MATPEIIYKRVVLDKFLTTKKDTEIDFNKSYQWNVSKIINVVIPNIAKETKKKTTLTDEERSIKLLQDSLLKKEERRFTPERKSFVPAKTYKIPTLTSPSKKELEEKFGKALDTTKDIEEAHNRAIREDFERKSEIEREKKEERDREIERKRILDNAEKKMATEKRIKSEIVKMIEFATNILKTNIDDTYLTILNTKIGSHKKTEFDSFIKQYNTFIKTLKTYIEKRNIDEIGLNEINIWKILQLYSNTLNCINEGKKHCFNTDNFTNLYQLNKLKLKQYAIGDNITELIKNFTPMHNHIISQLTDHNEKESKESREEFNNILKDLVIETK